MGATVTTRCAIQFVDTGNGIGFFMLEEKYEKNVYPHTPRWSFVGMGYREQILKQVFGYASDCYGGMLQSRSGPLSTPAYVKRWKKALDTATALPCSSMQVDVVDMEYGSGKVSLSLVDDFAKLALAPHSVISGLNIPYFGNLAGNNGKTYAMADAVFRSKEPGSSKPHFSTGYIQPMQGDEHLFIVTEDPSVIKAVGRAYVAVSKFVSDYWRTEVEHPGYFDRVYAEVVKAAENPSVLPAGTRLLPEKGLDLTYKNERLFNRKCLMELLENYPDGIPVAALSDSAHRYSVFTLPGLQII